VLELQARKHLEYLRKHAAYWAQGGTSSVENCCFGKNHNPNLSEIPPSFSKPNLDKPESLHHEVVIQPMHQEIRLA